MKLGAYKKNCAIFGHPGKTVRP